MSYDEVGEWLKNAMRDRGRAANVHIDNARRDNGWLYVPVYVAGDLDAYDKAHILQEVEDEWNDHEPRHEFQLLLVPAAN